MVRLLCLVFGVLLALSGCCALRADSPLLYLPFDGSLLPAISSRAAGQAASILPDGGPGLAFVPGRRGQAVALRTDCRLPSAGHLSREAGTVAFWIRPNWEGSQALNRTLFCLYGGRDVPESWMHNRWSLTTQAGRLTGVLYGSADPTPITVSADIAAWHPGAWHHVAFTWQGINSGQADGKLCLYLDGIQAQCQDGFRLDVGEVSDILDVGRDSDASPDYAEADIDEFYIYGRALAADELARAIALADQAETTTVPPVAVAAASACGPDWWNGAWRFRCAIQSCASASASPARRPAGTSTLASAPQPNCCTTSSPSTVPAGRRSASISSVRRAGEAPSAPSALTPPRRWPTPTWRSTRCA